MATVPVVFTTCLVFAAFYVAYARPLKRATTSFGSVPVRIIREGNNQLLSVSEEGAVFSNGTSSETDTCFLLVALETPKIELESSRYEGVFLGIAEDGSVKAAPKQELYASTFEITRFMQTPLRLADTDVECALSFTDDGVAQKACNLDSGSGSGSGSGSSNEPTASTTNPDLFTFYMDLVC